MEFWKQKAAWLKKQTLALYFALQDPRVPWYARGWMILIVAYAFSPIDLIPDFIPVLGYLDDLIIVPLGVYLAIRMVPEQIMRECQAKAEKNLAQDNPQFKWMAAVIIAVWIIGILLFVLWLVSLLNSGRAGI
jgi:uncharacterized membrane protein YkvA (DUF1232 family)